MPVSERELDMIYQSTMEDIVPGLQNTIFKPTPWLDYCQSIISSDKTGERIRVPLEMEKSTGNFQYFRDYETLNVAPIKGVRSAYYDWATFGVGVTVSRREEKVNSSSGKAIFNLLSQKIENTTKSTSEKLDLDLMQSNGEIDVNGNIPLTGLYTLVGDHQSDITTVGELSAVDNTWWRSRIHRTGDGLNPGADLPVAGEGQVLTMTSIDRMIDDLDEDGAKPARGFLRSDIKRALIGVLKADSQPIMQNQDMTLRTGFDNVVYRGVTFTTSLQINSYAITGRTDRASDIFWMPNSDALQLATFPGEWLTKTEWRTPTNQMARIMWILGMGNLIVLNRRWLGKTEKVARQA